MNNSFQRGCESERFCECCDRIILVIIVDCNGNVIMLLCTQLYDCLKIHKYISYNVSCEITINFAYTQMVEH